MFTTLYNALPVEGEINDGTIHTRPDDALSPADILERFVRDMPLEETSKSLGTVQGDLDQEPFPMQGQEYDPLEEMDKYLNSAQNK